MPETKEKHQKISKSEWVWIILSSLIALGGVMMITLGFCADYFPGKASENWTGQASFESAMHMSYRWFGVILLIGAAFISVIFLNYYAKKTDIDEERAVRRAERLHVLSASADAPDLNGTSSIEKKDAVEVSSSPKPQDK